MGRKIGDGQGRGDPRAAANASGPEGPGPTGPLFCVLTSVFCFLTSDLAAQTDGIALLDVDAFTTLVVRTDNSVYRITILTPHLREVLVQGGKFFPERTRACLSGSTFGGSCLKIGWVGLGLHMEFHAGGQWIITSHVRAIAIEASPAGAPC